MDQVIEQQNLVKIDVLVIGGGFGGLWAALQAAEHGNVEVALVDSSFAGMGGHSRLASGAMVVLEPGDDLEDWVQDIVEANDGLADRQAIRAILSNSYARLKDFESYGLDFPREEGRYSRIASRGTRHVKLIGGPEGGAPAMTMALRREALRKGVRIINRLFITNLLTDEDGRAAGALGLDRKTGHFTLFSARAIVLATNSGGFRGHHLASDQQGTGVFMAYEIGAQLKNAEFHYINIRPTRFEIEGSGIFPAFGGRWVNASNEFFMEKYDPQLKDRASHHLILTAMAREARAGKAPIGIDVSSLTPLGREGFKNSMMRHGWMPVLYNKLKRDGLDYLSQKVEWKPAYEANKVGIYADLACQAKGISGLFVAGMARSFDPNPLTGWSIACCVWSGYMAGKHAAAYAGQNEGGMINPIEVTRWREKMYQPLEREKGITPDLVTKKLQEILFPADVLILMTEQRLSAALAKVHELQELAVTMYATDVHELIKVRETETMLLSAEMSLRASLLREESRPHLFFREDYPDMDNERWLQWIIVTKSENSLYFKKETIPNA